MFCTFRVGKSLGGLRESSVEEVVLRASKDGQGSGDSRSATDLWWEGVVWTEAAGICLSMLCHLPALLGIFLSVKWDPPAP